MTKEEAEGKGKREIESADTVAGPTGTPETGVTLGATLSATGSERGPSDADSGREPSAGSEIGRFIVIEELGSGGMGVVLAAHDPLLDRKVAVKLLRAHAWGEQAREQAQKRLLREAQAMAKLSHPNVVAVHEVGTVGDRVFIAMDYVEGGTLRDWCRNEARSWREVCDLFARAGLGLAAAHRAGLVHRDFKPGNVLVGDDGRVCVTDFGLVSTAGAVASGKERTGLSGDLISSSTPLTTSLTHTGSILGTPLYMAPEQHDRKKADARADQFSFCVALYEALYGVVPFAGNRYVELAANVRAGRARKPPPDADVPTWVSEIVLRGLRTDPGARYPSMDALLARLADDPAAARTRRRKVAAIATGMTALAALAALTLLRGQTSAPAPCRDAEQAIAGVWDEQSQDKVRAAFAASERSYAKDVFERVRHRIDDYVRAWVEMRNQACAATRVQRQQPEKLMDLRMSCLDRRRDELESLVGVFAEADVAVLGRAINAVAELTPVRVCADEAALTSAIPPPTDPELRAEVDELSRELATAEALRRAGKYSEGLEVASRVEVRAKELDYEPIRAQAFFTLGNIQDWLGEGEKAEKNLYAAIESAARARADAILADSWIMLVYVVGASQGRPADAEKLFAPARAAAARLSRDDQVQADLANNIGAVLATSGKAKQARVELERAVSIWEKTLSPDEPKLAAALGNLGIVVAQLGDIEGSLAIHERAYRISEKAYGPNHPRVALTLNSLSNKHSALGRQDRAIEYAERALAIQQGALPPDHPDIAMAHMTLANSYRLSGEEKRAFEHFRTAVEVQERAYEGDHPTKAIGQNNFADVLRRRGQCDEAIERYDRAIAMLAATLGAEHPLRAYPLNGKAVCLYDRGDLAGAKQAQTEAMKLVEGAAVDPALEAELSFNLARTLWAEGRERKRAIQLARAARALFAGGAEGGPANVKSVDAWLAERKP